MGVGPIRGRNTEHKRLPLDQPSRVVQRIVFQLSYRSLPVCQLEDKRPLSCFSLLRRLLFVVPLKLDNKELQWQKMLFIVPFASTWCCRSFQEVKTKIIDNLTNRPLAVLRLTEKFSKQSKNQTLWLYSCLFLLLASGKCSEMTSTKPLVSSSGTSRWENILMVVRKAMPPPLPQDICRWQSGRAVVMATSVISTIGGRFWQMC